MTTSDVIALLERALRAELDLNDLVELWPRQSREPYLVEVREDLESALEHIPGGDSTPRRDLERWQQMPEYGDLQLHLSRLRARRESEETRR